MKWKYVCRKCTDPCLLETDDILYEPHRCPFSDSDAEWEEATSEDFDFFKKEREDKE